jgi:hypothetical protein
MVSERLILHLLVQPPFLAYRQPNRRSAKVNTRDDSLWNGAGNQSVSLIP